MRVGLQAAVVVVFCLVAIRSGDAQTLGTIAGSVTDVSGGVLPASPSKRPVPL